MLYKRVKSYTGRIALIIVLLLVTYTSQAQSDITGYVKTVQDFIGVKYDTSYVHDLRSWLTLRVYTSRDYVDYKLYDKNYSDKIDYKPNTPFNLGIGASYKFIGINIGFPTPFINKQSQYGKTKSFDLSSHFYLPKFTLDVYGGYYRGYHLNDLSDLNSPQGEYLRPDLRTGLIGISAQYILSAKKFSYMGTFSQMQYQKKSAGSFIFGAGVYTEFLRADSTIVPTDIKYSNFYGNEQFNKSAIYSITVNGGYAYTLVIKKHYFVSGSLNLGIGANYTVLDNTVTGHKDGRLEPQLNTDYRLATGYNSDYYYVSAQYVRLLNKSYTPVDGTRQDFGDGTYRLILAKRFKLKKHNVIDQTMDKAIDKISK